MRLSQPPYPSFTTVMATAGLAPRSTARLPTYHSAHLRRYHPYPMTSRRRDEDYLTTTVDHRSAFGGLEPIIEEPEAVATGPAMTCQELPDRDFCPCELDYPVVEEDLIRHYEETRRQQAETSNGHRRLAVAFVNMMFALRRKYHALLAVVDFLKGQEIETK
ncbi:hypothetical protein OH76DRAFT_62930 [Lentinus brumalis]|uniref:Uncharacterized protein n=1 Tax=Lentinus brumalis TaxID=2498619 RepID=A0A371DKF2_9APHY|nr:hypothetical protein OH76DRAFT_62930 [Polyporus brumalis]